MDLRREQQPRKLEPQDAQDQHDRQYVWTPPSFAPYKFDRPCLHVEGQCLQLPLPVRPPTPTSLLRLKEVRHLVQQCLLLRDSDRPAQSTHQPPSHCHLPAVQPGSAASSTPLPSTRTHDPVLPLSISSCLQAGPPCSALTSSLQLWPAAPPRRSGQSVCRASRSRPSLRPQLRHSSSLEALPSGLYAGDR